MEIGGKTKKLTKKQYRVKSRDKTTGKVVLEGKGKNFTGTLELTL